MFYLRDAKTSYDLPSSISDALPMSCKRLVQALLSNQLHVVVVPVYS